MAKKIPKKDSASSKSKPLKDSIAFEYITFQEPKPGKFKIVPGNHDGVVWKYAAAHTIAVEQVKKDYLKSINKSANSYLSQEQIDDYLKCLTEHKIRIMMPLTELKKNFARRFQRYLEREGITLEQIESQGFKHPAARRWLRNLYKNGMYRVSGVGCGYLNDLCIILGIDSSDEL